LYAWTRPETDPAILTAANVAYRRPVVARVARWMQEGAWENVVHQRLARDGLRFAFEPAARIRQNGTHRVGAFCTNRYRHGRAYARARLAQGDPRGQWARAASFPLLPWLLTWRVARAAARLDCLAFCRALPFTWVFLTAWSLGEAVGYLRGPADPAGS
jgi:hypothetical protein